MGRKPAAGQALLRGFMAFVIALYPMLSIGQEIVKTPPPVPVSPVKIGAKAGAAQGASSTAVYLRVDGNVAGRVSTIDPSGNKVPARAHVSFLQGGKRVGEADSNERGYFQVHALQPGVYSVIASGPEGFAATAVQVLPYAADAPRDQLLLELILVPPTDADALSKLLGQTDPVYPMSNQSPPISGGGGGGGGEGGSGLGAMALALAALGLGIGLGSISNSSASPTQSNGH